MPRNPFKQHKDIGALLSDDRAYRYALWRIWTPRDQAHNYIAFIGLNPSTADEREDDPTLRRCIRFAQEWKYDGVFMFNLFALRSTDPKALKSHADPVGPECDKFLVRGCQAAHTVVAAWGAHGKLKNRDAKIYKRLTRLGIDLWCLKQNKDLTPLHPLYAPKSATLVRYNLCPQPPCKPL